MKFYVTEYLHQQLQASLCTEPYIRKKREQSNKQNKPKRCNTDFSVDTNQRERKKEKEEKD